MLKRFFYCLGVLLLSVVVIAQDDTCPQIIYDAVLQASDACADTGQNEICYGNSNITAIPRSDAKITFAHPGDISPLSDIQSIQSSGLNGNDFGIALMRVQANVPNSLPGQVITFMLMGEASLEDSNPKQPLQAFFFTPGIGQSRCQDYNYDTLAVSSPEGLTVTFNVNGVDVNLGSTAMIVSQEPDTYDILVVKGKSTVSSGDETVTVEAGNWTQITSDGQLAQPKPFPPERVERIPFDLLYAGENVALGKPVTADVSQTNDPPENVTNGITTGNENWNAGSAPPHWIEIDLEQEYTVSKIRMLTSQYPEAQYDRTVHQVLVAGEDHAFRRVHTFDQKTRDNEWLEFTPDVPLVGVRYVRVESISSPHNASWGEIEVYSAGFVGCVVSASNTVNLRSGAGTDSDTIRQMESGETALVSGKYEADDGYLWWHLKEGAWVRSDVVQAAGACNLVPPIHP